MPSTGRRLRIAYYAPLKAPSHPVPSGDRLMAQMLALCIRVAGHSVSLASDLRAFLGRPDDREGWTQLRRLAQAERARIAGLWTADGPPDLWLCYHPYYKAPDLLGPDLSREFSIPYVTVEASYSRRRDIGIWADMQVCSARAVQDAAINLSLTARDAAGLLALDPAPKVARLAPFIDAAPFLAEPRPEPGHLVAIAMMRPGDKEASYLRLSATLAHLPDGLPWHLSVVGDGPLREKVQGMFAGLPSGRLSWRGQLTRPEIADLLARASVYVWPGCGEAYGLAYLEAQAAGVPVVAQAVAGVPEVVADGVSGFLTDAGDDRAAAAQVDRLLRDPALQRRMGQAARDRVLRDHSMSRTAERLNEILNDVVGGAA